MKILSIGNFGTGWDGSICDEEHIAKALEDLGHEVYRWQRDGVLHAPAEMDFSPDFILLAQWDGYPEILFSLIKEWRKPIVYWAFDYQADGQEWHERLVKESDLYLSKRIADSKYSNWHWLSQDFAPEFLLDEQYQFVKSDKDIDVLFTGSYLPWATERTEILKAIDDRFSLTIHSVTPNEWKAQGLKNVQGPIMDRGLPELYSRAKINISIDHTIEAGYWSDRNAQIMICGGFVLFRYVPMSQIVFESNIEYFYNSEDCLKKIDYYLNDEFKREHIAQLGRGFAEQNLMVNNRVRQLLTIVGNVL